MNDDGHIPWKVFHIAEGAGVSAILAFTGWAAHAPVWLTPVVAGALGVGVVAATARIVDRSDMFADLSVAHRESIVRWVGVASVVHVALVAAVAVKPELATYWAGGMGVFAVVEYWTACALEYLMTKPVHQVVAEARAEKALARRSESSVEDPRVGLSAGLERARMSWLIVHDHKAIRVDGRLVGWTYSVQVPSQVGKNGEEPKFGPAQAEKLARALREITGVRLMSDWVQIAKLPYAGEYKVTVTTEDVMGKVTPYVLPRDAQGLALPADPADPLTTNRQADGTPIELKLDQHGQMVGGTGCGKSSDLNVKIAEGMRRGFEFWVCGRWKLYDLLSGWLLSYEGKDMKTPFDWVMYGQQDTLKMYAAMLRLARYRQNLPLSKRRRWKTIICVTDEASYVLEDTTVKVLHDGRERNASDLAGDGTKATRSARQYWWFTGQRGTNDQFGDQGGLIKTNFGWVEVFMTKDKAEIGRTLGDEYYGLPKPRHKGEKWIDTGEGEPVKAKGPYIQEDDPSKDHLHDGDTLAAVSWALRNMIVEEPLDADERAVLGEVYANRYRTADELVAYLTSEPQAPTQTGQSGLDKARAEVDAILGIPASAPAPTVAPERTLTAVPTLPATRKERIVRLLADRGQMTAGEIREVLAAEEGQDILPSSLSNTLRALVDETKIARHPQQNNLYLAA